MANHLISATVHNDLVQEGSPVCLRGRCYNNSVSIPDDQGGIVVDRGGGAYEVSTQTLGGSRVTVTAEPADVWLNASKPTGAAHAAWFCFAYAPGRWPQDEYIVLYDASCNRLKDPGALRGMVMGTAASAVGGDS